VVYRTVTTFRVYVAASGLMTQPSEVYCSGMRPRDTTLESHEAQLQAYRRLGAGGRARLAAQLSAATRELTRAGIRARHPAYTQEEVELAIRRLLLGDDLFRRAWPGRPLLAP
jgi:hypothetical protein